MVAATQKQVAGYVATIRQVDALLDPATNRCPKRKRLYETLARQLLADEDTICQQMGRVMASFKPGLFAGGGRGDWPRDNLDLERWFRLPKGHERRIHGRCHAGVRIVQEGATMMLALDAHRHHPKPFSEQELRPYRDAEIPDSQKEVIHASQGDASCAFDEETRRLVTKTRRTVRDVTPSIKRVIES